MAFKKISIWKGVDWFTVILYLILMIMGWCCIYGAGYNFDDAAIFDVSQRFGKQLIWIGCSLLLGFVLLLIDKDFYWLLAYFLYGAMLVLLFITPFLARDIKGSLSWIVLGPVSLQPAEFAKVTTALALATFMGTYNFKLKTVKNSILCALIILVPMILIVMQKETGSALVYSAFLLVLYREGMSGLILYTGIAAVVIFILTIKFGEVMMNDFTPWGSMGMLFFVLMSTVVMLRMYQPDKSNVFSVYCKIVGFFFLLEVIAYVSDFPFNYAYIAYAGLAVCILYLSYRAIFDKIRDYAVIAAFALGSVVFSGSVHQLFNGLKDHQQMRIKVLLGMENDLRRAGYNVHQSKIAIGSGGVWGKGFLNGTQTKLKYVPEQDTDFIFCTVGEEHGFVGAFIVLTLFMVLLMRLIALAERQHTVFGRVFGYSVASILLFHVTINVGMVIGILPVIGIPLPFFSYGGSSLWGFTILLFIFLRINWSDKEHT